MSLNNLLMSWTLTLVRFVAGLRGFSRELAVAAIGYLAYSLAWRRRAIARRNLCLCFPDESAKGIRLLTLKHFLFYAKAFIDRTFFWSLEPEELRRQVHLHGQQHFLTALNRGPVILLAPHFLGLDIGLTRLQLETKLVSVYSGQGSPVLDAFVLNGRSRYNSPILIKRGKGAILRFVRHVQKGIPGYFLPDMDFGRRNSVFAKFMGQSAATVTSLARIVQSTGASIVPVVTVWREGCYEVTFYPAWTHGPLEDLLPCVQTMNDFIAERIRETPEQYLWTHRRFKTRPRGESPVYQ